MSRVKWDVDGSRLYETGLDRGMLYVANPSSQDGYDTGVAWNGLSSVNENPSGGDSTAIYADNMKYLDLTAKEDYGATIEAYTYPDEWAECDGSRTPVPGLKIGMQTRKKFGMSYRTKIGNDQVGDEFGYKIHIIYNAKAAPSSRTYNTINDSPEANPFSWDVTTTEVNFSEDYKPTATLELDSTKIKKSALTKIETILYGTDAEGETLATDPRLPLPQEIISIIQEAEAAG